VPNTKRRVIAATSELAVTITQASQPDPDRAARPGIDALAIARDSGSARIIRELRTLDSRLLSRWPGAAVVFYGHGRCHLPPHHRDYLDPTYPASSHDLSESRS